MVLFELKNMIGEQHRKMGDYEIGMDYMRSCLELTAEYAGKVTREQKAKLMRTLGRLLAKLRRDKENMKINQELLVMDKEMHGEKSQAVAVDYHSIGYAYDAQEEYELAVENYNKGLQIKLLLSPDEPTKGIADTYDYLGRSYWKMVQFPQAHANFDRALKMYKDQIGRAHV